MAKKAKKKKAKKKEAPPSRLELLRNGLASRVFSPVFLFLAGIMLLSTSVVPYASRFLPDLEQRPEYLLPTTNIEINEPPHWVPRDLVEQVIEHTNLPSEVSVLDADVTREIAEAFALHPWVKGDVVVKKSVPARIVVEMTYRRPVAMVEVKHGVLPIDEDGILLPANDFAVADTKFYPLIQDITSTPQGSTGTQWGDIRVETAAKLATYMMQEAAKATETEPSLTYWQQFGFEAIRIGTRKTRNIKPEDIHFELATQGGSLIVWGRSPEVGPPLELDADKKLGKLADYLNRFGSFDDVHGPYRINISHWLQTTRKRLSAAPIRVLR